ncbi:MAG: hypothetical protein WC215_01715 [Bacilli bacterium]|jgi:hypothetical protein|nr:hypothetical protein [Bacilli bacterium]
MKISDIVYKSYDEVKDMPRFDFKKKTRKPSIFLKPLMLLLCLPEYLQRKSKVTKINMKGVKPPFFMLCTHNSFFDFKVATMTFFPKVGCNVVAIDGFINREGLLRNCGCIGKRKFTNDPELLFNIKHILKNKKGFVSIYPEARYSLVGTQSSLPDSLGKMAKMFNVPVVVLNSHGHHIAQPVWNLRKRKNRTESTLEQILTIEDLKSLSMDEINERIVKSFVYDDYKWQKENNVHITEEFRAEGLHLPLYKCPVCGSEHHMNSKGADLFCKNCKTNWHMNELGELESDKKSFSHIPDWFEWERAQVNKEIKSGKYHYEEEVMIDSLPNATGFYRLGKGKLIHTSEGFKLIGDFAPDFEIVKKPLENFGVHIEYNYFGKGHCVSFSTTNDTFYIFPVDQSQSVTKLHFAVEELYKITKDNIASEKDSLI